MENKSFFLHEEVIDVFHKKIHIPRMEILSFNLSCVGILGSIKCGKTKNKHFQVNPGTKFLKLNNDYAVNSGKQLVQK